MSLLKINILATFSNIRFVISGNSTQTKIIRAIFIQSSIAPIINTYYDAFFCFQSKCIKCFIYSHSPEKEVASSKTFCPSCMYSTGYFLVELLYVGGQINPDPSCSLQLRNKKSCINNANIFIGSAFFSVEMKMQTDLSNLQPKLQRLHRLQLSTFCYQHLHLLWYIPLYPIHLLLFYIRKNLRSIITQENSLSHFLKLKIFILWIPAIETACDKYRTVSRMI